MSAVNALFFVSGFTGLVYEVLWSKYLVLTFGGTGLAQALVLAAFLGGLAAGNAFFGPKADRTGSPLRLYAALELGIALLGLLTPPLMGSRWGLALVALSAGLMGGTLPALSRWSVSTLAGMAASVSRLYFLNSLGAAAGSLAAGFLLIPTMGLDLACWVTSGLNALIGGTAYWLGKTKAPTTAPCHNGTKEALDETAGTPRAVIYAAALLGGIASLSLEIAWTRLLSLILGSSTYSFSVMLAAFVGGIGAGGWIVSTGRLPRISPVRLFALAELGMAAALTLSLPLYDKLPYLFQALAAHIPRTPAMFPVGEAVKLLFCVALMLPATVFLGMTLPLASRAATDRASEAGSGVGRVFAFNATGNVLGALAAGLWLMPRLGLEGLFAAGIAANLALAALLALSDRSAGPRLKAGLAALCAVGFAAQALLPPRWDKLPLSFVTGRLELPPGLDYAAFQAGFAGFRLLSWKDDREATVAVLEDSGGRISLMLNGKADASTSLKDLRTQVLLAQIPLLLRPDSRDVLIVGLGSGVTAGSALAYPLRRLDVVEISEAVVEAEVFFSPFNRGALKDPRLRLRLEDAKTFLARSRDGWDVVISEPSNPWIAGIGNLFSSEFYASVRAHLNPGGIMAQWFHLYEMDDETFRLALRTFAAAFPNVAVWRTVASDIILLGSERPLMPEAGLEAAAARPEVRAELERIGITRPATLLSLHIASDGTARSWAGRGPLNTDRFPRLEYLAPRAVFLRETSMLASREEDRPHPARSKGLALWAHLAARGRPLSGEEYREIALYERRRGDLFLPALAEEWARARPRDPEPLLLLAQARLDAGAAGAALELLGARLRKTPGDAAALSLAVDAELSLSPDGDRALALLERLLKVRAGGPAEARVRQRLGRLLRQRGDYRAALTQLMQGARSARSGSEPAPDALWMEAATLALDHEDAPALLDNDSAKELFRILEASEGRAR